MPPISLIKSSSGIFLFFCCLRQGYTLAQAGLKLVALLLPQLSTYWDHRHTPPCPTQELPNLPATRWGHLPFSESACSCWSKWRVSLTHTLQSSPSLGFPPMIISFLHYDHFLAFALSSHERTNGLYCLLSKPLKFLFYLIFFFLRQGLKNPHLFLWGWCSSPWHQIKYSIPPPANLSCNTPFKKKQKQLFWSNLLQFLNQAKLFSSQRVCTYLFIVLEILLRLSVTFPCLLK